jgi:hypothetical protein
MCSVLHFSLINSSPLGSRELYFEVCILHFITQKPIIVIYICTKKK